MKGLLYLMAMAAFLSQCGSVSGSRDGAGGEHSFVFPATKSNADCEIIDTAHGPISGGVVRTKRAAVAIAEAVRDDVVPEPMRHRFGWLVQETRKTWRVSERLPVNYRGTVFGVVIDKCDGTIIDLKTIS